MIDTKDTFKVEFEKCCDMIAKKYSYKKDLEREIVGKAVIDFLLHLQMDIRDLHFTELYDKYLKGSLFFDNEDFTKSESMMIINESQLSERDKIIAKLYWIEMKSEEDIAAEVTVDRKTIRTNIPKISLVLKQTAAKLHK